MVSRAPPEREAEAVARIAGRERVAHDDLLQELSREVRLEVDARLRRRAARAEQLDAFHEQALHGNDAHALTEAVRDRDVAHRQVARRIPRPVAADVHAVAARAHDRQALDRHVHAAPASDGMAVLRRAVRRLRVVLAAQAHRAARARHRHVGDGKEAQQRRARIRKRALARAQLDARLEDQARVRAQEQGVRHPRRALAVEDDRLGPGVKRGLDEARRIVCVAPEVGHAHRRSGGNGREQRGNERQDTHRIPYLSFRLTK